MTTNKIQQNNNVSDLNVNALWQQLRQSIAQPEVWLNLAKAYAELNLPWQFSYVKTQLRRINAELLKQLDTLEVSLVLETAMNDSQLSRANLPDAALFINQFAAQINSSNGDWLTWLYLARLKEMPLAENVSLPDSVHSALQQAQFLEPIAGETMHWMGVWRLNAGDAAGAITAFSSLLDIRPIRYGSMMFLGDALLRTGNIAAAEKAFARASLSPNVDFLMNLANKVYAHNYWKEAIEVLGKALSLKPDNTKILLAMAKLQSEVYELGDCRISLDKVLALDPNNLEARLLEAGLQGRMGDAKGHLATLQKAYESEGDPLSRLASSVAMTALYNDELSAKEVADLHFRLAAPIEASVKASTEFLNDRSKNRRLRIGWVTGDLHRQHPVNIFMLPMLLHFNHSDFEYFIYHTGTMHDEYTRKAKSCVEHWQEAAGYDDNALQNAILTDKVDILFDLAGHTASHRLGVFAMRAAPVQSTFLGYPHSTGLSSIDWLIGDSVVSPATHSALYSEGIAQLPSSVFCWAPVDHYPLPPQRAKEAEIVFASFNNAMKLSPKTIALWAKILHAVPKAKLLLKAPSLRDKAVQNRFAALFELQGIGRERLIFRGPSELSMMMQEYGDVDIGLDPTPYNGGTTTLQALWMGIPVVTLLGDNFVGRMGASFMKTLNKPEWVAADEDGYVKAAVDLANNIENIRQSRAQFRYDMETSQLCDIKSYVGNFEKLLKKMWANYCDALVQRIISLDSDR